MNQKHAREARIVNRTIGNMTKRDRMLEEASEVLPADFNEADVTRRTTKRIYFRKIVVTTVDGADVETEVIDSIPRVLKVDRPQDRPGATPVRLSRNVKTAHERRPHDERGPITRRWRGVAAQAIAARGEVLNSERARIVRNASETIDMRQAFRQMSRSKRNQVRRVMNRANHGQPATEQLPPELFR